MRVEIDADTQPINQLAAKPAAEQAENETDYAQSNRKRARPIRRRSPQNPTHGEEYEQPIVCQKVPNS